MQPSTIFETLAELLDGLEEFANKVEGFLAGLAALILGFDLDVDIDVDVMELVLDVRRGWRPAGSGGCCSLSSNVMAFSMSCLDSGGNSPRRPERDAIASLDKWLFDDIGNGNDG